MAGAVTEYLKSHCDQKQCIDEDFLIETLAGGVGETDLMAMEKVVWRGDINGDDMDDAVARSQAGDKYYLLIGGHRSVNLLESEPEATKGNEVVWQDDGLPSLSYANANARHQTDLFFDVGDRVYPRNYRGNKSFPISSFQIRFNLATKEHGVTARLEGNDSLSLSQIVLAERTKRGDLFRPDLIGPLVRDSWTGDKCGDVPDDLSSAEDKAVMLLCGANNLWEPFVDDLTVVNGTIRTLVLRKETKVRLGKEMGIRVKPEGKQGEKFAQAVLNIDNRLMALFEKYDLNWEQENWLRGLFLHQFIRNMSLGAYMDYLREAEAPAFL